MNLPTPRVLNVLGALACAGMMGFALYAQHGLQLDPCPLCVFQRIAVIALGTLFLIAAIHNARGWGRFVHAALIALAAAAGAAVAGRHVWIQSLPADKVPACGAGLDYMLETMPLSEVVTKVLTASGECGEIVWQFLGLSMPAWVLIDVIVIGLFGVWNNLRRPLQQ